MQRLRSAPMNKILPAVFILAAALNASVAPGAIPADLDKHLNLVPENAQKSYRVLQIDGNQAANILYPGDPCTLGLQVVNLTSAAIKTDAKAEVYRYGTEADEFRAVAVSEKLVSSTSFHLDVPAKGFVNVTVQPSLPQRFGAYVVVVDVPGQGRQLAAGLLRVPPSVPGKASTRVSLWTSAASNP